MDYEKSASWRMPRSVRTLMVDAAATPAGPAFPANEETT
jgi:hypothetical protein